MTYLRYVQQLSKTLGKRKMMEEIRFFDQTFWKKVWVNENKIYDKAITYEQLRKLVEGDI